MAAPMGVAGIVGTGIGGLVAGLGAQEAGAASQNMYQYKAGVALLNRQISLQNANWATQAGRVKTEEAGLKTGQEVANTKVSQSGSNLDVNSGSGEVVRKTQTEVSQFDQNVISWDAAKTGYGYETKAATDTAESNLDQLAGSQSAEAGTINMASSFLNAGSSVASKWSQGSTSGMFS